MNKREAKRIACGFAADLLNTLEDHEPFAEYSDDDIVKIIDALFEIAHELNTRSGRHQEQIDIPKAQR